MLKTDLNRAICSYRFLAGAIATVAIMIFGSIGMIENNERTAVAALQYSYGYNNIIELILLADAIVYSASFASEWQSGFYKSVMIRSNQTQYYLSKCASTAVSSGLSVDFGVAAYIIFLCVTQKDIAPLNIEAEVLVFGDLLENGHPILFFSAYLYVIFLQAMFFGLVGLLASGYLPNKYVAYATPFVVGRTFNQIVNFLNLPFWMDPLRLALFHIYGPTANVLFVETAVFLLLTVICTVWFVRIGKRRVANG